MQSHGQFCPSKYLFTPKSSEACKGNVPYPIKQHDIFLKILHQAGFETARQPATLAKRHVLTMNHVPS